MNGNMHRVGIFTTSGRDALYSPFINSVLYLSQCGYKVDIFALASDKFPAPEFNSADIQYIPIRLSRSHVPGGSQLITLLRINRLLRDKQYHFFIGFDPGGLINAAVLGVLRKTPYIYHSLEIVSESTLSTRRQRLKKFLERLLSKQAVLTITQDEVRADILARENRLDRNQVTVVYNAPLGEPLPAKSSWLRDRFRIPETQYIVLAVGSLIEEHLVDQIAESVSGWPEQFTLVLHGWFASEAFEKRLRQIANSQSDRVFISTELLPHDKRHLVFQSADIGLAFYKPVNENLRYVGAAAGKIFDFMRCGVPVIANDLPGMKELIEGNQWGVVISDSSAIPHVLSMIERHYQKYRDQSLRAFERYDFARSYARALNRILVKIGFDVNIQTR